MPLHRHVVSHVLIVPSVLVLCSAPASAQTCGMAALGGGGSGPPSVTQVDSSTTQVLEEVRRRQQQMAEAQVTPVSNETEPASETPAPPQQAQGSTAAQGAPAATPQRQFNQAPRRRASPGANARTASSGRAATSAAAGDGADVAGYGSLKDASQEMPAYVVKGVWAQGYADYERHSNLAPGQQENPTRKQKTFGIMSGTDWTLRDPYAARAFQFGVFSGYNDTQSDFSPTTFLTIEDRQFNRLDSQQDAESLFVGAYMAYAVNQVNFDLAAKVDFGDLSQSSRLVQQPACGNTVFLDGNAAFSNYVIAGNAAHRTMLDNTTWLEPVVGFRFTVTEFGSDNFTFINTTNANSLDTGRLGLDDGNVLRLQGGLRYGMAHVSDSGWLWKTTLTGLLYSDVLINGYEFRGESGPAGAPPVTISPVDEGKLRVLGQVMTEIDNGEGSSFLFAVETRGGEDVFGVGGQVGYRYEW